MTATCRSETRPCLDCGDTGERYSGVPQRCKECHKRRVRANRKAKLDYYQKYDRKRHRENPERAAASTAAARRWLKEHPKKAYKMQKAYREKYPEKYRARNAVSNALRDGKLHRQSCEVCNDPKTHGHHDDYSKPLDVRWLCSKCHAAHHVQARGLPALA